MNDTVAIILSVIAAIVIISGAVFGGGLTLLRESNKLLRDQNADLKQQNADLKDGYKLLTERFTAVVESGALLQGQINVLSKLPLKGIAKSLKNLSIANKDLAESNKQILEILESSAVTLALENRQVAAEVEHVRTELANHPAI